MLSSRVVRARLLALLAVLGLLAACAGDDPAADPPAGSSPPAQQLVRVPADAATISAGIDLVAPGGTVLVDPGVYAEEVTIDKPDVTLRGTDRDGTVIDGEGVRSFGVFARADGVRIENLTVHSTMFYGVLVTGMFDENGPLAHGGPGYTELDPAAFPPVERFRVDHVTSYNNGLYGIYAFNARHGVIADSYASGSADSGFYVGQCEDCDILVTGNVAERNAIGFENANASDSLVVVGNRFSGNRIGMTLTSNYQEAFTPQRENVVVGNLLSSNASADSPAHALGGFGVGLGITGGQRNEVRANRLEGNPVAGIALANTEDLPSVGNRFTGNVLGGNGVDVADTAVARAPSSDNCFEDNALSTAVPPQLLEAPCPELPAGADPAELPRVDVPPGTSFLQVTAPPAQPGLPDVETLPAPLPATVELPELADWPVPGPDLLADRAGTA